jgi:subtilisin family serine protease
MASSPWCRGLGVIFCLLASVAPASSAPPAGKQRAGAVKRSGRAAYIVQLAEPPLARYRGGVPGLPATNPRSRGERKLDSQSPDSRRYTAHLLARQQQALAATGQALGRDVAALHRYTQAFNGFALELTAAEAQALARLPGVAGVTPSRELRPLTDAGPSWIGAPGIWDGTATGGLPGTKGEGILVGMIDTGINLDHPSFADLGGDGYDHTNPRGTGNYVGWCDPANPDYDPALPCNDKLIGVWSYPDSGNDPEDDYGHGSHTAGTVAGNHTTLDYAAGLPRQVSGVAPHANLISYDVCVFSCPYSALLAGIDQAVADGVDVINFSIGGWVFEDPWDDVLAAAFLGAREAGVFVAASAGNSGPYSSSIGTPAFAPWLLTVGAATHDRATASSLAGLSGGDTTPPADLAGKGLTGGYGPAAIVHAGDFGNAYCDSAFAAGTFNGQIVVCDAYYSDPQYMGQNVLAGGAGGLVVANLYSWLGVFESGNVLPAVHIDSLKADQLRAWLASGTGHAGSITGFSFVSDPAAADVLAYFSSRGPNPIVSDVIKPDLIGPGVNVLAATKDPGLSARLSGTSMSSPHAAGAAALLIALHPSWTPAEVQSALMTTAQTAGLKREDGTTPATSPFDVGAGRVDLGVAARAGLVLDVTSAAFEAADPELGGDPATLNLASLAESCLPDSACSWTRTVRSTLAAPSEWTASATLPAGMSLTVTPSSFSLAPGATQALQISVANDAALSGWQTGSVRLSESAELAPEAHLPLAVRWVGLYELAVSKSGTGTGRVTSNPPGVDCGATCSAQFVEDTFVTLTATADPGSNFLGWGGDCYGASTCSLSMYYDRSAIAYFDVQPPDRPLANRVPVKDSMSSPIYGGSWRYYYADLASGNAELVVDLFDMTGDADLYVRWEQKPTYYSYDCQDYYYGTPNRRCVITAPAAGRWWVGVNNGDVGLLQYSVRASWGSSADRALQNGVPVGDYVSGEAGDAWKYYSADLSENGEELLVELTNLSADADLFVRHGAKPDRSNYDCISAEASTLPEACHIPTAAAGRWWIGVNNFSAGTVTYTIEGNWASPPATGFYTVTPCRLVDTRTGGPPLSSGVERIFTLTGSCGVPPTAKALSLNVTVAQATGGGSVVLYPGDIAPPPTNTVSFAAGQTRTNNAVLRLGTDGTGTLAALASGAAGLQVHLILDVNGYFE